MPNLDSRSFRKIEFLERLSSQDKLLIRRRDCLLAGAAWALMPTMSLAQDFSSKAIRMLNGFAAGGGSDYALRVVAPFLGTELKTAVVIENKTGASGMIAADQVAKAVPDGYMLSAGAGSAVMIAPQMAEKAQFNALTDLAPVNAICAAPLIISAHPRLGTRSLKELIALSEKRQITLASAGIGTMTHLVVELLIQAAPKGSTIINVPFKGSGPGISDAVAGHVDGIVSDIPSVSAQFADGRLIPLAVTSDTKFEDLPEVPTASDTLPGLSAASWTCVFAPAKTPQAVVEKISSAIVKVVALPEVASLLKKSGAIPKTFSSPEDFRKLVAEEYSRWGKLIREKHIVAS